MALRVAEAPQLAQGLAADAKIVGLVLPLLPPEAANATDAMGPTLAASPAHESFSLAAVAHELSWQTAMAELLSLVRLEGVAAVDSAAAQAATANAIEMLLASAIGEDPAGATAAAEPRPAERQPEHDDGFRPSTPAFVDAAFGDSIGVSVLSLQNKDLFGFDAIKEAPSAQAAGLDGGTRQVIDYDLFGLEGAQVSAGLTKVNVPIVVGGVGGGGDPIDPAGIGGNPDNGKILAGLLKLDAGQQNITMDLKAVLAKADDTQSLVVRGDGDDHLKLVGDWMLVSENTDKSVSVFAHSDTGTTVTADHVEVILA
jgi:hypothetical protein